MMERRNSLTTLKSARVSHFQQKGLNCWLHLIKYLWWNEKEPSTFLDHRQACCLHSMGLFTIQSQYFSVSCSVTPPHTHTKSSKHTNKTEWIKRSLCLIHFHNIHFYHISGQHTFLQPDNSSNMPLILNEQSLAALTQEASIFQWRSSEDKLTLHTALSMAIKRFLWEAVYR